MACVRFRTLMSIVERLLVRSQQALWAAQIAIQQLVLIHVRSQKSRCFKRFHISSVIRGEVKSLTQR